MGLANLSGQKNNHQHVEPTLFKGKMQQWRFISLWLLLISIFWGFT
jgi:hypothetical protein